MKLIRRLTLIAPFPPLMLLNACCSAASVKIDCPVANLAPPVEMLQEWAAYPKGTAWERFVIDYEVREEKLEALCE